MLLGALEKNGNLMWMKFEWSKEELTFQESCSQSMEISPFYIKAFEAAIHLLRAVARRSRKVNPFS